MNPLIDLESVSFGYKTGRLFFSRERKPVLNDISFSIYPGETLGIIGRNGAGKSSLLRLLASIFRPDSGSLRINCENVKLLSLELGFADQLSGLENIIMSGMYHGFSKREMEAKTASIVDMSGLQDSIGNTLITYSSGMRARLGFSIAFHLDPDVLLIDEVLGVGDVDFQYKSEALIKEKMRSDQTVVLVTHDYYLVHEICDRAVWIEDGTIHAQGEPEGVLRKYLTHMQVDWDEIFPGR